VHRVGDERTWWKAAGIDPIPAARKLWKQTRVNEGRIGPERTRIKLFAVPGQARNQHRITVEGEFGILRIEVENVPSENPRTGRLSYLSAIAMLRELGCPVHVGN